MYVVWWGGHWKRKKGDKFQRCGREGGPDGGKRSERTEDGRNVMVVVRSLGSASGQGIRTWMSRRVHNPEAMSAFKKGRKKSQHTIRGAREKGGGQYDEGHLRSGSEKKRDGPTKKE